MEILLNVSNILYAQFGEYLCINIVNYLKVILVHVNETNSSKKKKTHKGKTTLKLILTTQNQGWGFWPALRTHPSHRCLIQHLKFFNFVNRK